jgi:hypothetical protein
MFIFSPHFLEGRLVGGIVFGDYLLEAFGQVPHTNLKAHIDEPILGRPSICSLSSATTMQN